VHEAFSRKQEERSFRLVGGDCLKVRGAFIEAKTFDWLIHSRLIWLLYKVLFPAVWLSSLWVQWQGNVLSLKLLVVVSSWKWGVMRLRHLGRQANALGFLPLGFCLSATAFLLHFSTTLTWQQTHHPRVFSLSLDRRTALRLEPARRVQRPWCSKVLNPWCL
jgi:hypothetical protein